MVTMATFQPFVAGPRPGGLRASTHRAGGSRGSLSSGLGRHPLHPLSPASIPLQPHPDAQRRLGPWARHRRQPVAAQARQDEDAPPQQHAAGPGGGEVGTASLSSVGLFLLWGGLLVYAFLFSTNQTPMRDQYILKTLVGLYNDGSFTVNAVFTQLFFVMGIYPLIYTALLIPSGKSGNGVPAWPFVGLSYAFGAFGLLPYMALWTPPREPPQVPPQKKDLEGLGKLIVKGMESPITAAAVLLGSLACIYQAATTGPEAWSEYFELFDESRFVHLTSIDFLTLSALAPFWMYNDAQLRKWGPRDTLLPVLSVIPLLGPAIYLCLRPRAQ